MAEIVFDKAKFHKHMKDRLDTWKADEVQLGEDFAVFQFPYTYRAKEAYSNLKNYLSYYGYRAERDDTRLVVINTAIG